MKDKINAIDMNEKLDYEEIYNLFKTDSSKANKEISKRIHIFKNNIDLFGYYANKDIKNLLNTFDSKLSKNNDKLYLSFKSDIEQYISCISQIILSIKLFLKIREILAKTVSNSKNRLSKLKNENKLKNSNEHYLFSYLESLLKISKKNNKYYPNVSMLLNKKLSLIKNNPENHHSLTKFFSKHKTCGISNDEIKTTKYNELVTPRFDSKSIEKFHDQEHKNSDLENSFEINSLKKNNSNFTLSECIINEGQLTPNNLESKLIESPIVKPKTKITFTKLRKPQSINVNNINNIRQLITETNLIIENNKNNQCRNLLEMIKNIYKKGLINSEEKVKLKQLVIKKSKKIKYLYDNIYKNSNNDKTKLESEVKKIINSFVNN